MTAEVIYCSIFHYNIDSVLFAAESSLSPSAERIATSVVKAGRPVVFNCTLDANCTNQSIAWVHFSAFDTRSIAWYNRAKYNPELNSRGVTVEEDPSRGWSVLSIPRVRLTDRGTFLCRVTRIHHCQMNFPLIVTGRYNICNT